MANKVVIDEKTQLGEVESKLREQIDKLNVSDEEKAVFIKNILESVNSFFTRGTDLYNQNIDFQCSKEFFFDDQKFILSADFVKNKSFLRKLFG